MSFYKYHSTSGRRNRKKKNNICIHHLLFYNNVGLAYNIKVHFCVRLAKLACADTIFVLKSRSQKCGFIYVCFHASLLSPTTAFYVVEKNGYVKYFYIHSCAPVDIDEDYTSRDCIGRDWYNPHLYKY